MFVCRVLLEKLTVTQQITKSPLLCKTEDLISTVFIKACHRSLLPARLIHSTSFYLISLTTILILPSYVSDSLPRGLRWVLRPQGVLHVSSSELRETLPLKPSLMTPFISRLTNAEAAAIYLRYSMKASAILDSDTTQSRVVTFTFRPTYPQRRSPQDTLVPLSGNEPLPCVPQVVTSLTGVLQLIQHREMAYCKICQLPR